MGQSLTEIAADLYTAPLADFVAERNARAKAAEDRDLATQVRALRKPSVAAWAVNVFARERPDRLGQALQLAEELREAQADLDAATLAELGRQRRALTDQLAREAAGLARDRGERVTESTLEAVQQTLSAAFYDPDAAAAVASGRLVRDLGPSDGTIDIDLLVGGGRAEKTTPAPRRTDEVKARRERRDAERAVRDAEHRLAQAQREQKKAEQDQRDATAEAERLTAQVADLEAQLTQVRHDAERATAAIAEMKERETDAAGKVTDAESALARAQAALEDL